MRGVGRAGRAVILLALAVLVGSAGVRASAGTRLRQRAPSSTCRSAALRVVIGPPVVPATGEHAIELEIRNSGAAACSLIGYPTVAFRSNRGTLPFRYTDGGGPYLPAAPPKLHTIRPGARVWFIVAKYRCDAGTLASATAITVHLPGVAGTRTLLLRHRYAGWIGYCRKFKRNGPPDPGNKVAISAISVTPSGP